MAAASVVVTHLPAHPAHFTSSFDPWNFFKPYVALGGAAFDADGEAHANILLTFQDRKRCQMQSRALYRGRHGKEIPAWALNDCTLRQVVLDLAERRAFCGRLLAHRQKHAQATETERLHMAQQALSARIPNLLVIIDRLCHEFVNSKDAERRATLAETIRAYDSSACVLQRGYAGMLTMLLHLYFRCGHNACDVARTLSEHTPVTATWVRQQVHRATLAAARIEQKNAARIARAASDALGG